MKASYLHALKAVRYSTLCALATLACPVAWAQETGWYGALSLGKTTTDIESAALRAALQRAGANAGSVKSDDEDSGWKLTGGYSFSDRLALEASYADLGDFGALATLQPSGRQFGEAEVRGLSVDLVGSLPLTARVSAFGRVGIGYMGVSQDFSNHSLGTYFADGTERGAHEKYGFGVEYRITEALAVRSELERYRLDDNRLLDDRAGMFSLGLVYRFGGRKAPVQQPVVRTPEPAPAPRPVTITLAASALFDFDRFELKPAGKAELDKLVRDLEGLRYEVVIVTGHTDRIGTRSYNLVLSERRAATVRDYLVAAGVPNGVIRSRGVNSDAPVTTPEQCQGPVSDALKACLQPDRRVEVEVSGTRAPE